jgi:urea transport system permease protein
MTVPPVLLRLLSPRGWALFGAVALVGLVLVPVLHGAVPAASPLHLPDHLLALLGKFACYALAAVALDLIWGFAGILSLGHGVFFALGGYAMGMYLMLGIRGQGVYRSNLPDFMVFLDWKELPWFWHGFDNFFFALAMTLVVPGLLAFAFGYFAFRSRIRGVYFSIITQALTYALMLLFFRNDTGLGGNNGLTDFKQIYGYPLTLPSTKLALYVVSFAVLLGGFLLCRAIVTAKIGRVLRAVRDEGALYVPQVGIINPSELQPANSIEMVIWTAVGGRGTLGGAALGAFVVSWGKNWFTGALPELWLYVLGALFILVTLFIPEGIVGLGARLSRAKALAGAKAGSA